MSDGTLFAIGAVVFIIGGLASIWYLLDVWQAWRDREAAPDERAKEPKERILHRNADDPKLTQTDVTGT